MLAKKKKLSRKKIKEDKLVSLYYKSYNYFYDNKAKLIGYGIGILIVAAAVVFYINYRVADNQTAGVELSQMMNYYDNGSYLEAIEGKVGTNIVGLKKIVEKYGSTEKGEIAKIYLANSYNRLGEYDEALKYYEDYDGDTDMYKATALAGEAGIYAGKKQYLKAANLYKEAASVTKYNVLNPDYLMQAGINYLAVNLIKEAKQAFQKIREDYHSSSAARNLTQYLALLD